ncbi:MAG: hypothetical protein AAF654_02985 [Myxococcota bacterium]
MDYLAPGLLENGKLRAELEAGALATARRWVADGHDPQAVECLAELLARIAEQLGEQSLPRAELVAAFERPVRGLLEVALPDPAPQLHVAAAAVHVLDIAEQMALKVYLAELPSLIARADRTGDAARNVGIARHLRG